MRSHFIHFTLLLIGMMISGFIAVGLGKELQWDLVSYHFYNSFAMLHHRWGVDDWPPTYVQMFFNPIMDLLNYFLIQHFTPVFAVFCLGAIHGINFWLIYGIAYIVLTGCKVTSRISIAIMLAAVGMYNPVTLSELGSFMGDNLISIFGLSSVWLQLYFLQNFIKTNRINYFLLFLSGLMLGLGIGLKLTLMYFVGGFIIAYFFIAISFTSKIKIILIWAVAVAIGFLISYGYWMMFLWSHYQNPFYPAFNGIFKAPNFPFYNWHDDKFFPHTLLQKIFYPFYFSKQGMLISEFFSTDYRFVVIYLLMFASGIVWLFRKLKPTQKNENKHILNSWLVIFFIFAYIAWECLFSNIRYFVSLEIMAPVIIYLLLYYLIADINLRRCIVAITLGYIVITMHPLGRERFGFDGKTYFNVTLPTFVQQEQKAMVLTVVPNFTHSQGRLIKTNIPAGINATLADETKDYTAILQTYLIPFFPSGWRFVGVTTLHQEYMLSSNGKKIIQQYAGPIYLLTTANNMPSMFNLAASLGLHQKGKCGAILSDRLVMSAGRDSVILCQIKK